MSDALFNYLPKAEIIAAFKRSPGNELASGKFASPESSAALAANTFGGTVTLTCVFRFYRIGGCANSHSNDIDFRRK